MTSRTLDNRRRLLALLTVVTSVVWIVATATDISGWRYAYWALAVATVVQLVRVHRADKAKVD